MRTRSVAALGLAAVFAIGCSDGLTTEPASMADGGSVVASSHGNNGAIRWIPDPECGVFDGLGRVIYPVDAGCRNAIATFSKNGNAMLVVRASGVPNPTGKAVRFDAYNPPPDMFLFFPDLTEPPLPCGLYGTDGNFLWTVNWSSTVSASGEAKFICHFAEKWEFTFPD